MDILNIELINLNLDYNFDEGDPEANTSYQTFDSVY